MMEDWVFQKNTKLSFSIFKYKIFYSCYNNIYSFYSSSKREIRIIISLASCFPRGGGIRELGEGWEGKEGEK